MTGAIFTEWLKALDRKMKSLNRKIILIVDNCSAHPCISNLESITLLFLPPNTTSKTQPLDAGIIKNMKHYSRRGLIQQRLLAFDSSRKFNFDLFNDVNLTSVAWNKVSANTITNCYKYVKFLSPTEPSVEKFKPEIEHINFENIFERLRFFMDIPLENYEEIDNEIETASIPTDQELVQACEEDNGYDLEKENPNLTHDIRECSTNLDMLDILAKVKLYLQSSTVTDSKFCQFVTVLNDMEDMVSINILQKPKQTLITQFFSSNS